MGTDQEKSAAMGEDDQRKYCSLNTDIAMARKICGMRHLLEY